MKMSKKTKRRLFKAILFARGLFLAMFAAFIAVCAMAAGGNNVLTAVIFAIVALVCFGLSIFCDALVDGYKSPFYY